MGESSLFPQTGFLEPSLEATVDDVMRYLDDIMRQDIPFEDKAQQALEVGREYLGEDNAHLAMIDQETGHWEIMVSTDSGAGDFPPGLELDLQNTYCENTIEVETQVSTYNTTNDEMNNDSMYRGRDVGCYIGTPLCVRGDQYGSVVFVSSTPREEPYSSHEKLLAELIAQILEEQLEEQQYERKITQQKNLTIVLNRVLRHNLRNDMSVIRGYTQLMVEELQDTHIGEDALKSIDELIQLSEKARELDEILLAEEERKQTNIVSVVEQTADEIRSNYPSSTISVNSDGSVTNEVFPSFKRSIEELIENAAKHGGNNPTIDITIQSVPNAVEIHIEDDGPGIDNQEKQVLQNDTETPLMHGSGLGLWLSNWVISQHDGSLDAKTTPTGTEMVITLPRAPVVDVDQQVGELVRAIDQYKAAFDQAGDGMLITDNNARIIDANEKAAEIYRLSDKELLGRSLEEFIPDDFDFESEWREVMDSQDVRDEMYVLGVDGGERVVEYTAETDVVPGQHLIVARDISDRVEREKTLEQFKAAVENAGHAIFFTDENGTIKYVNNAFEQITGYSFEEAVGETPDILNSGEMTDTYFESLWETIRSGDVWEETVINQRKGGEKYTAVQTIAPITDEDGEPTGYVAVQADINSFE